MFKTVKFKIPIAAGIFSLLALGALAIIRSGADSIEWERDYEAAVERAASEEKIIVADLFTDWCAWCKRMDAETFAAPAVIESMAGNYVWLKLNAETDEDGIRLQERFAVTGYPTLLLLDEQGEEIDRIDGYVPADRFKETVEHALQNPESLGRLRQKTEKQPQDISSRYELAKKYLERKDYKNAGAQFRRVLELDPREQQGKIEMSRFYLALVLASQEEYDDALAQLDELEDRFPQGDRLAEAAVLRGQIYYYSGEPDKARDVFQTYLKNYPDHGYVRQVRRLLSELEPGGSVPSH